MKHVEKWNWTLPAEPTKLPPSFIFPFTFFYLNQKYLIKDISDFVIANCLLFTTENMIAATTCYFSHLLHNQSAPYNMLWFWETSWRNGSASDSRSEGCVFKSRRGHNCMSFFLVRDENSLMSEILFLRLKEFSQIFFFNGKFKKIRIFFTFWEIKKLKC